MRTFQYFPLIYKPQTAPSSFFILNAARMNQPSFSQIVQLVERNERNLSEFRQILLEFKQGLDALIGKVDFLADQFIARNQPVAEVSNSVVLDNEGPSFQTGTSFGLDSFGIFDDSCSAQAVSDPYVLPPRTAPASMVYRNGVWSDPLPATPRVQANPTPPVNPSYDRSSGGYPCSGDDDTGDDDHQSTEQWAGVSAQQAEASTSSTPAKPNIIENYDQSESSTCDSSPKWKYDRTRNTEEKKQLFPLICEALGLTWNGDEISTLRITIERLGGTVPAVSKPIEGSRKSHTWKLKKRAVYLRKLKEMLDIDGRFVELNVLDGALRRLTNDPIEPQGFQPNYQGYNKFRA